MPARSDKIAKSYLYLKKNIVYTILSIALFLIFFAATLQIRSYYTDSHNISNLDTARIEELQKALKMEKERSQNLENALGEYKADLEALQSKPIDENELLSMMNDQLTRAKLLAGLSNVKGRGVIVTLDDTDKKTIVEGADISNYIIHYDDLLRVVNELRNAGAEAISVNGERLTAQSEITCSGNIIIVNSTKIAAPFVVKAIGDPSKLSAALNIRYGMIDQLTTYGIKAKVEQSEDLYIPAYSGSPVMEFAVPVTKGGELE